MITAGRHNHLSGLNVRIVTRIWPDVSLRPIFAMMIAFAMLFAPVAMPTGAMAMTPAGDHSQVMASEHCGDRSSDDKDSKATGKSCCAAMCAAVAIAPGSPVEPAIFARAVERPALEQFRHGILAKLPTPPPRLL